MSTDAGMATQATAARQVWRSPEAIISGQRRPKGAVMTSASSRRDGIRRSLSRPDDHVMVLFGATGDLARRKLVPALYNLARNGYLSPHFAVIGLARTEMSDDEFRAMMTEAVQQLNLRSCA